MERYTLQEPIDIIKIQYKKGENFAGTARKTAENIAAVAKSVEENPGLSIARRFLELGIPQTSLHLTLHKDFGLQAYKVQLTQELKLADLNNVVSFRTVLSFEEVITIGYRGLLPLGLREREGLRQ